ncbi:hypothetical protein EsH8_VII_000500 [Colletotrichum jinshuiense]
MNNQDGGPGDCSEFNETAPGPTSVIAHTYYSVIETCQWENSRAVIKRFRHREDPRTPQRWRNEVDALNLAGAHDKITLILASDPGDLTITLRHEPGRSLDLYIDPGTRHTTLSPADADLVWSHVSGALAYLHSRSILHDDVKPDNIIFSPAAPHPRAVLIDFGAALVNPSFLPSGGWTPSGTPPYAPPEFLQRRKGYAGDIWGLGVTMLFCLGRVPLPDGEWILPHVFEDEAVRGEMVAWLGRVEELRGAEVGGERGLLAEMLNPDPDARIGSGELARRLAAFEVPTSRLRGKVAG